MNSSTNETGKQKVALITGATGFVGKHLARRLVRANWQVHILSRASSRLPDGWEFDVVTNHVHDGSIECMTYSVAKAKPDVVFHLASLFLSQHTANDIEPLIESNLLFSTQLLEAMQINGIGRIINTGTSWQHYKNENYNPVCLYAATKQAFEAILEYYIQAYSISAITLKLFDTYGPDDSRAKLFSLLDKAASCGVALDMSGGEQLMDLVHIDDVVDAYLIAAQRLLDGVVTQHETYAVSSGHPLPLKELVNLYTKEMGGAVAINWGTKPYRDREVMIPWNNGQPPPGWKPDSDHIKRFRQIFQSRI